MTHHSAGQAQAYDEEIIDAIGRPVPKRTSLFIWGEAQAAELRAHDAVIDLGRRFPDCKGEIEGLALHYVRYLQNDPAARQQSPSLNARIFSLTTRANGPDIADIIAGLLDPLRATVVNKLESIEATNLAALMAESSGGPVQRKR